METICPQYNLFEGDPQFEKVNAGKRVTFDVLTEPKLELVIRIPREKLEERISEGKDGSLVIDEQVTYIINHI